MQETNAGKPIKYCLECGNLIGVSRKDKKYCSSECRIADNNERRKQEKPVPPTNPIIALAERSEFKKVYEILLKNRNILYMHDQYLGDKISLRDLLDKGFNLEYFTSIFIDKDRFEHRCCFDYGTTFIRMIRYISFIAQTKFNQLQK